MYRWSRKYEGLGRDMWRTLKGKNQDDVNYEDEDEYLQDKAKDPSKFKQCYQLQIIIFKTGQ